MSALERIRDTGWLGVRLDRGIDFNEVAGAVEDAYPTVAPKRLVERYLA